MKAIVRNRYGSADVLGLKEVAIPGPSAGQVLVKVHTAGVNPLDWHVLRGKPFFVRLMGFGLLKPKRPGLGSDLSGRVEAVGKDVSRFKVGDEVFGSGSGCFAEYALCPEKWLLLKPGAISFEQAAGISIAGVTALQGLRAGGAIEPGQRVLINGASGGVGTFAVQIAKAQGAHVTGVCSARNIDLVRSLGADVALDYSKEDYWRSSDKYDLVLDNAAYESLFKLIRAVKPSGKYVLIGGSTANFWRMMLFGPLLSKKHGRKVTSVMTKLNEADLTYLKELIESGKVRVVIEKKYTLSETPQALRIAEEGHTRGKTVVQIL